MHKRDDRLKDFKPSKEWVKQMQAWERTHKPNRAKTPVKPSGHKARINRSKKK